MQCVICRIGTTRQDKASFTAEKDGSYVIFTDVDAEVCDNCGEAYFSKEMAQRLLQKSREEFKKGLGVEVVTL